jgi:hypothetical protein
MCSDCAGNTDLFDIVARDSPAPPWCQLTFDKHVYNNSDAIVFSGLQQDLNQHFVQLPAQRYSEHLWTFFLIESPTYYGLLEQQFTNVHVNYDLF